jgi:hypothetical protein
MPPEERGLWAVRFLVGEEPVSERQLRLRVLTSGLDIPLETSPDNRKEPEPHQC